MNKVIAVNLNGNAFQLEESGYEALRSYLDNAARSLADNPDREEIIADIEQAIADKFRVLLSAFKNVVTAREVASVIAEMGPVNDGSEQAEAGTSSSAAGGGATASGTSGSGASAAGAEAAPGGSTRRLYRINEGAMIAGVCNGISAYVGIDVTLIRIVFVLLAIASFGFWTLAYVALAFVIPMADSAAQKAAAHGATATAQEFIRRARQGYYEYTKGFSDRAARRAWRKKFKRDMREWRRNFAWEMRTGANQCQQNWQQYWAQHPAPGVGAWLSVPLLTGFEVVLSLFGLVALISLIVTGALFGIALPAGMPLWLAIVLLFVVVHAATWPFRAARHYVIYRGAARPCGGGLFWLGVILVVCWFVFPHETRDFLHAIPPAVHHAVEELRAWWAQR